MTLSYRAEQAPLWAPMHATPVEAGHWWCQDTGMLPAPGAPVMVSVLAFECSTAVPWSGAELLTAVPGGGMTITCAEHWTPGQAWWCAFPAGDTVAEVTAP